MTIRNILEQLEVGQTKFSSIRFFSAKPGIYAIYFIGYNFPGCERISQNQLIYIGKTESSHEKRNAKTHFSSGKTGSSTLRKSIGSLLKTELNLNPIPRNNIDFLKRRYSHFTFDDISEKKITEWMSNNLALAFFEFSAPKEKLNALESVLINELCPILNIVNNKENSFRHELQERRKLCADSAHKIVR